MAMTYKMTDWNKALVDAAKSWPVRVSQKLFDIIDGIVWEPEAQLGYDASDDMLELVLVNERIMIVDMFSDESIAVYIEEEPVIEDAPGEQLGAITATLDDLPAIVKMYNLLEKGQSDETE